MTWLFNDHITRRIILREIFARVNLLDKSHRGCICEKELILD